MHFKWAIEKVTKHSMSFPQIRRGGGICANHIHEWDIHWKVVNASFEETFNVAKDLQKFNGRIVLCGMATIHYKHGCHLFQELTHMTTLGTL
jgi:hypothetical protein